MQGRYSFYMHILMVLPTLVLQESSTRWLSWLINVTEYGNGEALDTEQFRNVQESERYGIHVDWWPKLSIMDNLEECWSHILENGLMADSWPHQLAFDYWPFHSWPHCRLRTSPGYCWPCEKVLTSLIENLVFISLLTFWFMTSWKNPDL